LHIHPHDHIPTLAQRFHDLTLGHAFVVAIDQGVFQKLVIFDHVGEALQADEMVIFPIHLVGAGRARCGRHHAVEIDPQFFQGVQGRIFAHT